MAGFPTDRPVIDAQAGQLALTLRNTLDQIGRMKVWLDGQTTADLEARGYTADEAAVLKSAYTDLDNLRKVALGEQAQSTANDFLFWARGLIGVN